MADGNLTDQDVGIIKSHEAEDITDVPEEYHLSKSQLLSSSTVPTSQLPHLFMARDESRRQGRRAIELKEKRDLQLLSIEARRNSFEGDSDVSSSPPSPPSPQDTGKPVWEGPCIKEMAKAGWRRLSSSKAECCYCKVTTRNWCSTDNAWVRHKHFSPCCRRLRQVGDGGVHPAPEGKKRLRHSFSSVDHLKRPV